MNETYDILDTKPPYSSDKPFPNGLYKLRVTEVEKGLSKNGNDQLIADVEVVSPERAKFGDEEFTVSGTSFKHYFGLSDAVAAKDSGLVPLSKTFFNTREESRAWLGNPQKKDSLKDVFAYNKLVGLEFYAEMGSRSYQRKNKLTDQDILDGKTAEVIRDENNRPVFAYNPEIIKFVKA